MYMHIYIYTASVITIQPNFSLLSGRPPHPDLFLISGSFLCAYKHLDTFGTRFWRFVTHGMICWCLFPMVFCFFCWFVCLFWCLWWNISAHCRKAFPWLDLHHTVSVGLFPKSRHPTNHQKSRVPIKKGPHQISQFWLVVSTPLKKY